MSRKEPHADVAPFPHGQREGLPTVFTCLFCNHEKSVEVKLDKKAGCGTLDCKTCGQKFQCQINCAPALPTRYLTPSPFSSANTLGFHRPLVRDRRL